MHRAPKIPILRVVINNPQGKPKLFIFKSNDGERYAAVEHLASNVPGAKMQWYMNRVYEFRFGNEIPFLSKQKYWIDKHLEISWQQIMVLARCVMFAREIDGLIDDTKSNIVRLLMAMAEPMEIQLGTE